nr:MAG: hypothetical protein [Bacteriophage sp.]
MAYTSHLVNLSTDLPDEILPFYPLTPMLTVLQEELPLKPLVYPYPISCLLVAYLS